MAYGAVITLLFALILDRIFADPKTAAHPVAVIGKIISIWGKTNYYPKKFERLAGFFGWILTECLSLLLLIAMLIYTPYWFIVIPVSAAALYFTIGWKSLEQHVQAVEDALNSGDEKTAEEKVRYLVSRDTKNLNPEQIRSAAYESASENLVDSITAPIFWYAAFEIIFKLIFGISGFGITGAVMFRAANTMDAMLGYKDERIKIGSFPARADDILAYLPARITGLILIIIFTLSGRAKKALTCLKNDRKKRPGINGGIPMSLIAGGCGVAFDKPNVYKIGTPEIPLKEGGRKIIKTIRLTTVILSAAAIILLTFI